MTQHLKGSADYVHTCISTTKNRLEQTVCGRQGNNPGGAQHFCQSAQITEHLMNIQLKTAPDMSQYYSKNRPELD